MSNHYKELAAAAVKKAKEHGVSLFLQTRGSQRKGMVGLLSDKKSIWGGPTSYLNIHFSPKHLKRLEAEQIAMAAIHATE